MKVKKAATAREKALAPLTFRDEDILQAVNTYRYMTARDITYLLFSQNSITYARERLAALAGGEDSKERAYLYRFAMPSKTGSRERVYTLVLRFTNDVRVMLPPGSRWIGYLRAPFDGPQSWLTMRPV
jgi:hypothetical protein